MADSFVPGTEPTPSETSLRVKERSDERVHANNWSVTKTAEPQTS